MVIGEYPCCNGELMIPLPDRQLPCFSTENCPHCGCKVWHRLSRLDPQSWTDEAFHEEFDVDETTRQILPRIKPDAVIGGEYESANTDQ